MFKNTTRTYGWMPVCAGLMLMLGITGPVSADDHEEREKIEMSVGRSNLVSAPWPVAKVSVAEPTIADVQVAAPDQVVVLAKGIGRTDLVLWSEDGQSVTRMIDVHVDIAELQTDLDDLFPDANLTAGKSRDLVTIRGMFNRAEDAQRMRTYLDTVGLKHLDMTSVAGVQQVLIKVRIAEASRQSLRSLGINGFHTGNDFFGGSTIGGNPNGIDMGVLGGVAADRGLPFTFNSDTLVSPTVTAFFGVPELDLQLFLQALEDNQYMRTLAEPSLVAVNGEEASFLAGGEFPIPVVQGSAGGDSASITIEFKEFGIRLRFRPTVLGDGTIRMKLAPEVSQLSDVGAVEIEGFRIPSLSTRRAETTLEMASGQTFALAGLLDQSTIARNQSTPGLGSMPVLGSLFRSVRYQQNDTELVVLATVTLVEPLSIVNERPLPGDLHDAPSDWELYANGWIEGRTPAKTSEMHAQWMQEHGLDQLRGPGAWHSYTSSTGTPMAAPVESQMEESPAEDNAEAPVEEAASMEEPPAEADDAGATEEAAEAVEETK